MAGKTHQHRNTPDVSLLAIHFWRRVKNNDKKLLSIQFQHNIDTNREGPTNKWHSHTRFQLGHFCLFSGNIVVPLHPAATTTTTTTTTCCRCCCYHYDWRACYQCDPKKPQESYKSYWSWWTMLWGGGGGGGDDYHDDILFIATTKQSMVDGSGRVSWRLLSR